MTIKSLMTASAFDLFCCANNPEFSPVTPEPMPGDQGPTLETGPNTGATADPFDCIVPPALSPDFPTPFSCVNPILSSSRCIEGRDFTRTFPSHPVSDVIVLSLHGGGIEVNTSQIGDKLANMMPQWDRYDFNGHGTPSCLQGGTNYAVLGITSTHFNDPDAVALVRTHKHAVSIQGKGDLAGAERGTICVGGLNRNARNAFILAMHDAALATVMPFPLRLIDATTNTAFPCSGAAGISRFNIVNLVNQANQGTSGGLQLALGQSLRDALVSTASANTPLQTIFANAVKVAMSQP